MMNIDSKAKIYLNLHGQRFANVCYSIFNVCHILKSNSYNYKDVLRIKLTDHANKFFRQTLLDNYDFFKNIEFIFDKTDITYDIINNFTEISDAEDLLKKIGCQSNEQFVITNCKFMKINLLSDLQLAYALFYDNALISHIKEKFFNYLQYDCIGLHVRRGDFCKLNFAKSADDISIMLRNNDSDNYRYVLCCSDDIAWCRQNIKRSNVIFIENQKPYEDMILLALCQKTIGLSQSSFFCLSNQYRQLLTYEFLQSKL